MFRSEALSHRHDRLAGNVAIAIPLSWQVIAYGLLGSLLATVTLLSLGSYARVETVPGVISPDKGVVIIVPSRPGVLTDLFVHDGEFVEKDTPLAVVRVDQDLRAGESVAALNAAAIANQDQSLSGQERENSHAADAQIGQLSAQQEGLRAELVELQSQISLQHDLVASAQKDYENVREIATRGFVSKHDVQSREDLFLARKQQLAQLEQIAARKRSEVIEIEAKKSQVAAQAREFSSNIAANRAQVAQLATTAKSGQSYVLRAPIAGMVSAIVVRPGQAAAQQTNLMSIVPDGSKLRAELNVPSKAIGFIKPGQEVRLALDAFPFERFGTMTGKVVTVAQSAIPLQVQSGATNLIYPVTVALDEPGPLAYGRQQRIIAGMTLTARVVTERQSLIRWLFDPIFAVRRR